MDEKYLEQASVLLTGGFFVVLQGHFDLALNEIAELLYILDQPDSLVKVNQYYIDLKSKRDDM